MLPSHDGRAPFARASRRSRCRFEICSPAFASPIDRMVRSDAVSASAAAMTTSSSVSESSADDRRRTDVAGSPAERRRIGDMHGPVACHRFDARPEHLRLKGGFDATPYSHGVRVVPREASAVTPDHGVVKADQRIGRMIRRSILANRVLNPLDELGRHERVDDLIERSGGAFLVPNLISAVRLLDARAQPESSLLQHAEAAPRNRSLNSSRNALSPRESESPGCCPALTSTAISPRECSMTKSTSRSVVVRQ